MSTVNNATGVYATLGYNFSDPNGDVLPLSANSVAHLNFMPPVIKIWQAQDIANNTLGGYFQNPLTSYLNTIITVSGNLIVLADTANTNGYSNALVIVASASALLTTTQSYLTHTNRISGITAFDGSDTVNPYYDTAIAYGKSALYITNQTDGITNTSPIMGSFTSLFIGQQISDAANTLLADVVTFGAAVTANTLTIGLINQVNSDVSNTNTLLSTRQTADVTYYTNLKNFISNYNSVKRFSNLGESESYLLNNFVGSPKLISRINS